MKNEKQFEEVSVKIKTTLDEINAMANSMNDRLDKIIANLDIILEKDKKQTNNEE
jgi:hypothetical protein